jgi:hypothetical protein
MHVQPRWADERALTMMALRIAVSCLASEISSATSAGSSRRFAAINRSQNSDSRDSLREIANFAMKSAFV